MFTPYRRPKKQKDEGERPFWISFSDLMTALMALFLVVMSVTLLAVTKKVTEEENRKIQREQDIRGIMQDIRQASEQWEEVNVDENTYRIDLGEVVRFDSGQAKISITGQQFLRQYVPVLLKAYHTPRGQAWIRRIVVEGFTDQDGSYLYNLHLSLERSRQVVCALYAEPTEDEVVLSDDEKTAIRELFLVGGYSFNSSRDSKDESRRVEFKLEFWQLDEEKPEKPDLKGKAFGQC